MTSTACLEVGLLPDRAGGSPLLNDYLPICFRKCSAPAPKSFEFRVPRFELSGTEFQHAYYFLNHRNKHSPVPSLPTAQKLLRLCCLFPPAVSVCDQGWNRGRLCRSDRQQVRRVS